MLCKLIYRSDGKRVIFFKMNERERNLITGKPTLLVQVQISGVFTGRLHRVRIFLY